MQACSTAGGTRHSIACFKCTMGGNKQSAPVLSCIALPCASRNNVPLAVLSGRGIGAKMNMHS